MVSKLTAGLIAMLLVAFAGAAAVHAQKPADVIQSLQSQWPGIQTELMEVKRMSDNTVRVMWRWRNTTNNDFSVSFRGALEVDTYLLDPSNKKKHLVVTDAKGNVIGSRLEDSQRFSPNQSVMVWARFPAPPAAVDKITVVIAQTPPFEDVTISK